MIRPKAYLYRILFPILVNQITTDDPTSYFRYNVLLMQLKSGIFLLSTNMISVYYSSCQIFLIVSSTAQLVIFRSVFMHLLSFPCLIFYTCLSFDHFVLWHHRIRVAGTVCTDNNNLRFCPIFFCSFFFCSLIFFLSLDGCFRV